MDITVIDALAEKHMGHRRSHKEREIGAAYNHGKRVSVSVIELRKHVTDDSTYDDMLRAAALFHDIGKGIEPHAHSGAVLTRDLLAPLVTPDELDEIVRLISLHCERKKCENPDMWQMLIQDADLLDHFGTAEVWMNFNHYAYFTGGMLDAAEFMNSEYEKERSRMLSALNFELSKRIFNEKLDFNIAFGKRLSVEARGGYVGI